MRYLVKGVKEFSADCVQLPASKSISNRALVLNALAGGMIEDVANMSDCDDTNVLVAGLRSVGAQKERGTRTDAQTIDIGAAGTSMRFLTTYLSLQAGEWVLTGSERMKQRPIRLLVDALRALGTEIAYEGAEGFPPLRIKGGTLKGGAVTLESGVSSQYISSLLLCGGAMAEGLRLRLSGEVISEPYIEMTLRMLSEWGVEWTREENQIEVRAQHYAKRKYEVEPDWSSASYWYEAVALSGDAGARVTLPRLKQASLQGDSGIADLFEQMGVHTEWGTEGVTLSKGERIAARLDLNLVEMPDMAQTVIVTACVLGIPFEIGGLQSLHIKETDRIAALQKELGKLGYAIEETAHGVVRFDGKQAEETVEQVVIDTYKDHRMAMAFAPASLRRGALAINEPEVVSKSYPTYWDDLQKMGFAIEKEEK